jgi:hypothetical protein
VGAATYHFKIEQGSTFRVDITYKDENGDPVDLNGYSARMQLRRRIDDVDPVLELTTGNGRLVLGGDTGNVEINVNASDTEGLDAVEGVYDLELISGAGIVDKLLRGTFEIIREVTR